MDAGRFRCTVRTYTCSHARRCTILKSSEVRLEIVVRGRKDDMDCKLRTEGGPCGRSGPMDRGPSVPSEGQQLEYWTTRFTMEGGPLGSCGTVEKWALGGPVQGLGVHLFGWSADRTIHVEGGPLGSKLSNRKKGAGRSYSRLRRSICFHALRTIQYTWREVHSEVGGPGRSTRVTAPSV